MIGKDYHPTNSKVLFAQNTFLEYIDFSVCMSSPMDLACTLFRRLLAYSFPMKGTDSRRSFSRCH